MLKPSAAKIVEFETSFDAVPVPSAEGQVIWADVRIEYTLAGLSPTVTIRVPVPWESNEQPDERKAKALRSARLLIDHACQTAGMRMEAPVTPITEPVASADMGVMEGLAQELGIAEPTTQPRGPGTGRALPTG